MSRQKDLELLRAAGIELVLVDIGASFQAFEQFQPLLPAATYVGFDPDQREVYERRDTNFHRYTIVNKAVVPKRGTKTVRFFLTKHPACSSTLPPNLDALGHYLMAHRFEVVDEVEADAVTLDEALAEVGLERVDWLKLDTQGTDLRLIESIEPRIAGEIMAVDAEPGFDRYYEGEDTFIDLHQGMTDRGFWLADLEVMCAVRLRPKVLSQEIGAGGKLGRDFAELTLKGSPTAAMARYLRTLESLENRAAGYEAYLRLWACAYFSANHPYALQVLHNCAQRWPQAKEVSRLRAATIRRLRRSALRATARLTGKLNLRNLRRLLTKSY
jgi:FkbM family methyltransferase